MKIKVSVRSILYEILPNKAYKEATFPAYAAEPSKTFLKKIFLLHEKFIKPDKTKIRTLRMSRHLYDLSKMMDAAIDKEALADKELYNILISHQEWYIHISWMGYATLQPAFISFLPPAEVMEAYKNDYEIMKEQMIYGEAEEFD